MNRPTGRFIAGLIALGALLLVVGPKAGAVSRPPETTGDTSPETTPARLQQDFASANDRALGGDQEGAVALYRHLIEAGLRNADVYFNLGNSYAELGRKVDAIVAYERGLRLTPQAPDLLANLAALRAELAPDPSPRSGPGADKPTPELAEALEPLVGPLPADALRIALLLANAGLFGLLWWRRAAIGEKFRRLTTFGLSLAILCAVGCGAGVLGQEIVARNHRGVLTEKTDLKEGPHARFATRGQGMPGERVRLLRADNGWTEIRDAQGLRGWIPSAAVIEVDAELR